MNYNDFFSINASELQLQNTWSHAYLQKNITEDIGSVISESIVVEKVFEDYYNLIDENPFFEYLSNGKSPANKEYSELVEDLLPHVKPEIGINFQFSFKPVEYELYAYYDPNSWEKIYLQKFYEASDDIKRIVTIHERMHAFHHINWPEFPNASKVYKEFLAQLFTYIAVKSTYLGDIFEILTYKQPHIYRTWLLYIDGFEAVDVFKIFQDIKSGIFNDPFVNNLAKLYPD